MIWPFMATVAVDMIVAGGASVAGTEFVVDEDEEDDDPAECSCVAGGVVIGLVLDLNVGQEMKNRKTLR